MDSYLGIDGGGTRTRGVLAAASGEVLAEAEGGASNYHNADAVAAADAVARVAEEALERAGHPRLRCVYAGCAGIKARRDIEALGAALARRDVFAGASIEVANDLHNALAGGLAGRPGIALIAGTGSNSLGRDGAGATFMCGGWGWLLDDRGGGFGLAIEAVRHAARSADGREAPTALLGRAMEFFGVAEPNELLARFYVDPWTPDGVAAFAPEVMRCAAEGDATAARILETGAAALAELVGGVFRKLDFSGGPDVVLLGGCVSNAPVYAALVADAVRNTVPGARIVAPVYGPAYGAAINALRYGGIAPLPERICKT